MQCFVDDFDKRIPLTNIVDKGYTCIAVSWQLGERENSCFFNRRLQGVIESSTLTRSIDRQQWHQIDLAMKELST
jgi:hypothetical protein